MRFQYLTQLAIATTLGMGLVVGCGANPCGAKTPANSTTMPEKVNPCAAKTNPCAAKTNPCAAKTNPCAAKKNPCAAKTNPCASKK
jgi:hypothetical protein